MLLKHHNQRFKHFFQKQQQNPHTKMQKNCNFSKTPMTTISPSDVRNCHGGTQQPMRRQQTVVTKKGALMPLSFALHLIRKRRTQNKKEEFAKLD